MGKMGQSLVILVSVLLLLTWVPVSLCAKKPEAFARKEDVPYIKCQVCEKLASQLYQQVQSKQAQISPKKVFLSSGFAFICLNFLSLNSILGGCFVLDVWCDSLFLMFGLVGC